MMFWLQLLAVCFFALGMASNYPCCCTYCNCCNEASTPSTPPIFLVVTFTGVANAACATCDDWNTTAWEVPIRNTAFDVTIQTGGAGLGCNWVLLGEALGFPISVPLPCGFEELLAFIDCSAPGTGIELYSYQCKTYLEADVASSDGGFNIPTTATPINCRNPGNLTYQGFLSNNTECDWSGATCNVTQA